MKRVLEVCALCFLTAILVLPCASAWFFTNNPEYFNDPHGDLPVENPEIIDAHAWAECQFDVGYTNVALVHGVGSTQGAPFPIPLEIQGPSILVFCIHYTIKASLYFGCSQKSFVTVTLYGRIDSQAGWGQSVMQVGASVIVQNPMVVSDEGYLYVWWANCPNDYYNQFQLIIRAECEYLDHAQWFDVCSPDSETGFFELVPPPPPVP